MNATCGVGGPEHRSPCYQVVQCYIANSTFGSSLRSSSVLQLVGSDTRDALKSANSHDAPTTESVACYPGAEGIGNVQQQVEDDVGKLETLLWGKSENTNSHGGFVDRDLA